MKYYIARPMRGLYSNEYIKNTRLVIRDDDYIIPATKILSFLPQDEFSDIVIKSKNEPDYNEIKKRIIASKNFDIALLKFEKIAITINDLDLTSVYLWKVYIEGPAPGLTIIIKNETLEFDSDEDAKLWFEMRDF